MMRRRKREDLILGFGMLSIQLASLPNGLRADLHALIAALVVRPIGRYDLPPRMTAKERLYYETCRTAAAAR